MQINKALIKPKILYFLFLSVVSSLLMYLNMYLMQKGINEFEIGLIDTVGYIVGFFMRPLCGFVADRYQAYRLVLIILMVTSVAGFNGLLLLPKLPKYTEQHTIVNAEFDATAGQFSVCLLAPEAMKNDTDYQPALSLCNCKPSSNSFETISRLKFLKIDIENQCNVYQASIVGNSSNLNSTRFDKQTADKKLTCEICPSNNNRKIQEESVWNREASFAMSLMLKTIGLACYSPLMCLLDAVTFSLLGNKPGDYGWTRMYGSFGVFITALLTGFVLYGYSSAWSFETDYTPSFILATVLLAVAAAVTLTLKVPATTRTLNPLKALPIMCLSWRVAVFFVLVLLSGASFGIFESFLAVILRTMFNPPQYFFGIMFAVQVVVEAPLFALSGPIIGRIGEPACFVIGFLAFALRFLLTSLVPNCWLLLAVNILHGLSFGLMFPAMLLYAARQAPEGWQGAVQGLVSGIYFGIGQALGAPVAGALIHLYGNRPTLRIWSCISLGFGALAACYMLAMRVWPAPPMSPTNEIVDERQPKGEEDDDEKANENNDEEEKEAAAPTDMLLEHADDGKNETVVSQA